MLRSIVASLGSPYRHSRAQEPHLKSVCSGLPGRFGCSARPRHALHQLLLPATAHCYSVHKVSIYFVPRLLFLLSPCSDTKHMIMTGMEHDHPRRLVPARSCQGYLTTPHTLQNLPSPSATSVAGDPNGPTVSQGLPRRISRSQRIRDTGRLQECRLALAGGPLCALRGRSSQTWHSDLGSSTVPRSFISNKTAASLRHVVVSAPVCRRLHRPRRKRAVVEESRPPNPHVDICISSRTPSPILDDISVGHQLSSSCKLNLCSSARGDGSPCAPCPMSSALLDARTTRNRIPTHPWTLPRAWFSHLLTPTKNPR